ncbi:MULTISPECIES: hypothetical protein [Acidianus]|uniref:Uncharacterized protein n=1 Tax=Candidatus Acidianus copahuensis TaxID=1160895 RepID=A0A031LMU8_9CREN|nr:MULTISPECIES: hypothetical protein [Acidianus]EZQ06968.1 hypothetical protein CM19_06295 [Candidatus Acidianus copahuensis]NON62336.1 hypothetical protein [Acidianus sp. RZ1]
MSSIKEVYKSKVDYRIMEIANSSPSTEILATVILNSPPSEDIIKQVGDVKVEKTFNFMQTIKVRGKAKDVVSLAEKEFVTYIMLDEILVKNEEWI